MAPWVGMGTDWAGLVHGCWDGLPLHSPALLKAQPRKNPQSSGASPIRGLWSGVKDSEMGGKPEAAAGLDPSKRAVTRTEICRGHPHPEPPAL